MTNPEENIPDKNAHRESATIRKSVRVPTPIEQAFSAFVERMETWWPAEHHIGTQPFQSIFVEPRAGGRWFERDADGNQCDWGRVLRWEPPHRVTFSWHLGPDFRYNPNSDSTSEVEIRFIPEGPAATLVELEHSRIERHGEGYQQLRALMDGPGAWVHVLEEFARVAKSEVLVHET